MTDDTEARVVEAMARAMCIADGYDPDDVIGVPSRGRATPRLRWNEYEDEALRLYRGFLAMQSVLLSQNPQEKTDDRG